ncbi:MAG: permease prefix domain 1-containing protein [Oscillospiraceae bacterium]|nr:permease prefix domain 1-containing protein [Oscillospiraceae bacterium]
MENKLRKYVDDLFEGTPPTRKAVELKEEMIQNLEDKYKDLIAEGKTPEAAFNIAVAGIGDVSTLLKEIETSAVSEPDQAALQKSAMFTAVAVTGYILSVLPWILFGTFGGRGAGTIGFVITLLMIAGSTGLLIYNAMTKPRYHKESDTMVEEFREWQAETHDRRALRRAISTALWSIIVALYFIISFWTFAWHITWIIFILGAAIESIINIFFSKKK